MDPAAICTTYLNTALVDVVEKLSSPQIKAVLKEGGLKVKLSSGIVTQKKRRQLWGKKIVAAIENGNNEVASELIQQWLLNHERELLCAYLDGLGVNHTFGETDDSFLFSLPPEKLRQEATKLLETFPEELVATYLSYIAYQQRSAVFEDWAPLVRLRGGAADEQSSASANTPDEPSTSEP
jgi:hypothetical protein